MQTIGLFAAEPSIGFLQPVTLTIQFRLQLETCESTPYVIHTAVCYMNECQKSVDEVDG